MPVPVRSVVPVAALVVGAALAALPGGCGRNPSPEPPTTVRGAVTFQGQPLAGGLVVFSPDPERGGIGKPARGEVGPDGRYELLRTGERSVPPGWYRVAVAAPQTSGPASVLGPVFPPQLARPDLSGLVREVKAGQENVFDFAVEVPMSGW